MSGLYAALTRLLPCEGLLGDSFTVERGDTRQRLGNVTLLGERGDSALALDVRPTLAGEAGGVDLDDAEALRVRLITATL